MHCHYSVAMDMVDQGVGTVVLLLSQGRGVVALIGMDNQGVVGFSGMKYKLLTRRGFPLDDAVPLPLLAA